MFLNGNAIVDEFSNIQFNLTIVRDTSLPGIQTYFIYSSRIIGKPPWISIETFGLSSKFSLYSLRINLSYCVTTNLSMYADDHQMYHTGSDQSSVTSKIRDSARTATKWYDSNLLAGNLKKSQTMNIGYSQDINSAAHAICVNNEEIKTVENLKLLGVIIDSKLNCTDHISSICKKASQRIGVLMRLRNLIPTKAKLVLFKSAVLPYLTYCHLVWHFCRCSQ